MVAASDNGDRITRVEAVETDVAHVIAGGLSRSGERRMLVVQVETVLRTHRRGAKTMGKWPVHTGSRPRM